MTAPAPNKHQRKSAKTREKLIEAAEHLYGNRSIDAVSLREITAQAGQKNPNALQYHFQNRDGLLQAIVDKHSAEVAVLRDDYLARAAAGEWPAAEAAARCLVMPIVEYIENNPTAVNFVKIVSQITAYNQMRGDTSQAAGVDFPQIPALRELFEQSLSALPPREAHRRIYLAVNTAFHSIADIYRASESQTQGSPIAARGPMVEQLICLLQSFLSAHAR